MHPSPAAFGRTSLGRVANLAMLSRSTGFLVFIQQFRTEIAFALYLYPDFDLPDALVDRFSF